MVDLEELAAFQRKRDCDVLIHGNTREFGSSYMMDKILSIQATQQVSSLH